MQVVYGTASIDDVDRFLAELREIGRRHDSVVQAMDARYVAGPVHIERAVSLARRAHDRGEGVADDLALEVLLYAAGTRQIDRAVEIGVSEGDHLVAIVVDGGEEESAVEAIERLVDPIAQLPAADEERLAEWFDVGDAERSVTTASLTDLVLERVALLEVEK